MEISLVCDSCGLGIHHPEDGWLEWLVSEGGHGFGFRVCHSRAQDGGQVCHAHNGAQGARGVFLGGLAGGEGIRGMVDILMTHNCNRTSWSRMFIRLWESGLMEVGDG